LLLAERLVEGKGAASYGHMVPMMEAAALTMRQLMKLAGSMRKNVWTHWDTSSKNP
jgi:hypothetical protein